MKTRLAAAWIAAVVPLACVPSVAGPELSAPGAAEAMNARSSAVKLPTEPELFGWDPASRANLHRLHLDGVVAVRYVPRADGGADLELLSNCIGKSGRYRFTAHPETQTKVARNETELRAALPIGSARFSAQLSGNRVLRTDYQLVGVAALPAGMSHSRDDLVGAECSSATHVVTAIYFGGFAVAAGEAREMEASGSVFSAAAGGVSRNSITRVETAGEPEACAAARQSGKPSPLCSAPLRIALAPLPPPQQNIPLPPRLAPEMIAMLQMQQEMHQRQVQATPPGPPPPALPTRSSGPPDLAELGRRLMSPTSADTGVMTGVVTDRVTGRPLANVTAAALLMGHSEFGGPLVFTDREGRFRIPRLPAAQYSLSFQVDGYRSSGIGPIIVGPGETKQQDVTLQPEKPARGP